MELSKFGQKFTQKTGILQLMEDLGDAMASDNKMLMLGGGNPAHIPEMEKILRRRMENILANEDEFERMIGDYDNPQGQGEFLQALAALLKNEFGWRVTRDNLALTNGSQSSFFFLFNMFAGEFADGSAKKILLPLAPEYIGYADVGLSEDLFKSYRPNIEYIGDNEFKYRVDFSALEVGDDTGAICVSRPTNPTGNVLTDEEVATLASLAQEHKIPFIIDNAYGTPFPNIIFNKAEPVWDENIILCMSLSKFGLPACRTGIVIARPEVIKAITGMNAIMSLAIGSVGAVLVLELVKSGEIIDISREIIKPYYQKKSEQALSWIHKYLKEIPYRVHSSEGALFLWLWFKDLPITSQVLYERLKKRNVLVVPGHYFFPGMENEEWRHKQECIRMTYSQSAEAIKQGIEIIGEEVRRAYQR